MDKISKIIPSQLKITLTSLTSECFPVFSLFISCASWHLWKCPFFLLLLCLSRTGIQKPVSFSSDTPKAWNFVSDTQPQRPYPPVGSQKRKLPVQLNQIIYLNESSTPKHPSTNMLSLRRQLKYVLGNKINVRERKKVILFYKTMIYIVVWSNFFSSIKKSVNRTIKNRNVKRRMTRIFVWNLQKQQDQGSISAGRLFWLFCHVAIQTRSLMNIDACAVWSHNWH